MSEIKIEYVEVEKLKHYSNNSKIHTKAQIEHIVNSIREFGFNDPIGIAGEENIVLEGNGRLEAAKLLGMKTVPCIRLDDLSEEERCAYVIAHNATNLETGFDDGILLAELKKLQEYDFNSFGIDVNKYLRTFVRVQKRILKPLKYVHYLISLPLNHNDEFLDCLDEIKEIEGG